MRIGARRPEKGTIVEIAPLDPARVAAREELEARLVGASEIGAGCVDAAVIDAEMPAKRKALDPVGIVGETRRDGRQDLPRRRAVVERVLKRVLLVAETLRSRRTELDVGGRRAGSSRLEVEEIRHHMAPVRPAMSRNARDQTDVTQRPPDTDAVRQRTPAGAGTTGSGAMLYAVIGGAGWAVRRIAVREPRMGPEARTPVRSLPRVQWSGAAGREQRPRRLRRRRGESARTVIPNGPWAAVE